MPPVDTEYMPVPFHGNITIPTVIRPDGSGHYVFKHNTIIKLSCAGTSFKSPTRYALNEISVTCFNGFLDYRGRPLYFTAFKCKEVPRASIKLTRMNCQKDENKNILEIGFQTKGHFLRTFRICFDLIDKKTLYSWYYMNSPLIRIQQVQVSKPKFTETRLYDGINFNKTYENQKSMLERTLNSTEYTAQYLKNRVLVPGHLLAKDEFIYVSEQHATYFYENTVPMWSDFHILVWKLLEKLFRRSLIRGNVRHLIVAGVYGTCTLTDVNGVEQTMYLSTENRVPVPKYVWKMDYDLDRRSGTVFIAYNHPHDSVANTTLQFCEPIPCPGELSRKPHVHRMVFCCTKDSFEKVVGYFDYLLFRPF